MSEDQADSLKRAIENIVGKYALYVLAGLLATGYGAGMWMGRLDAQLDKMETGIKLLSDNDAKQEAALQIRLVDWKAWREGIEKGTANRFTSVDYDFAVYIARKKNPSFPLPYFTEIRSFRE